jgi:MoaA/NifB/PqqE/SkfB family radical SAM enzyme
MPFYGAEYTPTGFTTPCCLLDPLADINQVQNDMLNGRRSSACDTCWKLEDQGKVSDRLLKNSAFDFFADKDIRYIEEDCKNGNFSPKILKLYTSNLCNSTCVTCNSHWSTAWATLKKEKTFKIVNDSIPDQIDYTNINILSFVGGEPLYEKKNFDILERLILADNLDCFITFVSNGSTVLTAYQKNILKHFTNLNICLSIDGINSRFEYVRYPLKWNNLLENIDFYKQHNVDLSVSYTISNLNIFYYVETVEWFNSQGLSFNHNLVTDPAHFGINSLPKTIKDNINSELFREHQDQDDINFKKFLEEIHGQDRLKNISLDDYLPEFSSLIRQNT